MSDKEKQYKFKGTIIKNVYSSPDFKIFAVKVDKNKYPELKHNKYNNISILGELHDLIIGVEYEIVAVEQESKYGISYQVIHVKRDLPTTVEETYDFLSEILTEKQADVLIEHCPNIIQMVKDNDLDNVDLSKLKGIGEATFKTIKRKIEENFQLMDLVVEFKNVLTMNMIRRIYEKYPSIERLKEKLKLNPYTTLTQVSRVGFKTADTIVLQLQKENIIDFGYEVKTSADRCLSCVLYLLEENESNGNTRANLVEIRTQCLKLVSECINHYTEVIKDKSIYYDKDSLDIALRSTYNRELYIANSIKYGLSVNRKWDFNWKSYQNKGEFNLSDEQIELLHFVCENNVVILTGGAGNGKSASTKMLIEMLKDNNKTFILASPTGKSAKVLKDFSGTEAKTIHRVLGFNPKLGWLYCCKNKLDCDVLLIDELSMVSVDIMYRIIDAIDFNKTKLVMIGDPNQLPSLQCGNLLHDFLASKIIPTIKLTKVFRYGSGGILTAATDIINSRQYIPNNKDKIISLGDDCGYTFIKANDELIIKEAVLLYKKLITIGIDGYIYKPEEIAILTAYNKGDYGASILNKHLQKIANKNYGSEHCFKHGESTYYIDDIIMQRVNDYAAKVYSEDEGYEEEIFCANGEVSKITLIAKDYMVSDFDEARIKHYKGNLSNLSLSYSYSIHKSQGSTIKVAIVISPRSHIYLSSSNLLYVAITRASDKCFHFGLPSTVNTAMKKRENYNRKTFIKEMLMS